MKKFLVRCLVNDGAQPGAVLGYVGRDDASGGYPYSSSDIELITKNYADAYMTWVGTKSEMSTYSNGGKTFPLESSIFNDKYRQHNPGVPRYGCKKGFRFELIELDFTDALFVESKILRIVEVEGVECDDYQGQHSAFYNIKSDQSFS